MRIPGRWMKHPDPYILTFLAEDGPAAPSRIKSDSEFPWSKSYIGTRCRVLADNGFVRNLGNGTYQITDRGKEWLDGEFDARVFDEDGQGKATA